MVGGIQITYMVTITSELYAALFLQYLGSLVQVLVLMLPFQLILYDVDITIIDLSHSPIAQRKVL